MTDYRKAYLDGSNAYHSESRRLARSVADEASYENGVMRWHSNGQVPPEDVVDFAAFLGHPVIKFKNDAARRREQEAFLAEYRAKHVEPSEEERFEARAAFGPGVKLVNVFTGREWVS